MRDKKYKKIVVLDSVIFYPEHTERLDKIAEKVVEYNTCHNEQEVLERVKGADCIISCWINIPNRVIDENPQLKTVAFWTHAYEHRIDKEYALKHGIHLPSIPDYGTDSVAELVFIGLLQLYEKYGHREPKIMRSPQEEILAKMTDGVRKFHKNWRDNLRGSWIHEYVKTGKLKITSPDEFKEETLKGLTVGLLTNKDYIKDLSRVIVSGFKMNLIYSLGDLPHMLDLSYRPINNFLRESHVIIYDSRTLNEELRNKINQGGYLSIIDVAEIIPSGETLVGKKIGIIGLGRIGSRVAQIAKDGFNMDVSYFSKKRNTDLEKKSNIKFKPLDEILETSDIISFHLPHIGAEKVITRRMVESIPPGTTVVNISVGNIFEDQDHFLNRFRENDLRGYIDVYDALPPREELKERKNYLASTYRLGWRTKSTIGLKTHKLITQLEKGLSHL